MIRSLVQLAGTPAEAPTVPNTFVESLGIPLKCLWANLTVSCPLIVDSVKKSPSSQPKSSQLPTCWSIQTEVGYYATGWLHPGTVVPAHLLAGTQ